MEFDEIGRLAWRRAAGGLSLWLALAAGAPASPVAHFAEGWHWRRGETPSRGEPVTALAIDAERGRLALGDSHGVLLRRLAQPAPALADGPAPAFTDGPATASPDALAPAWRRWPSVGAVNDLHFDADGALWIASERGLWRLAGESRLENRSPAPGEIARRVHRIRSLAGLWVAASDAGAFVSANGVAWRRILHGLPASPVTAVALRRREAATSRSEPPGGLEIWLLCAGDLWRVVARPAADGPLLARAQLERIPGRPAGSDPNDVAVGLPGADLAVLYPEALARVLPAQVEERRWEVWYPVLPPGASTRRLSNALGLAWLATDRGLLLAGSVSGPWRRTASPAGSAPVGLVVGAGQVVYVAAEFGLIEGRRERTTAPPSTVSELPTLAPDPDLRLVHRRALAYAGLEPEHFRRLRRGLARRGWLPLVSLRTSAAYDRNTSDDHDQTFSYGELHDLRDRGSGRSRDFDGSLTLTWDFGDVAYPADAPDLSREQRQVVTLRDNVLDEISQLYFDRRRTLQSLLAYADRSDPQVVALELRCQELAAGLDAWTGGWFSSQSRARCTRLVEPSNTFP